MKTLLFLPVFLFVFSAVFVPFFGFAQNQQTDWIIRDFSSTITANKDSSLLVEERITADADSLPDKHGIFRVLPTQIKTEAGAFKTPVQIIGITDFDGKPQKFSTVNDNINHTITWKIGDPNVAVSGLNYYKITYLVKNAIRFGNPNFDELYWNLSGSYWQLPIEKFSAKIVMPSEINPDNVKIDYYTGYAGSTAKDLATYNWFGPMGIEFVATKTLAPGEGITASISVPKNIFMPYASSFWESYGNYFWFLIPLVVFILCYLIWNKYGKDPRVDKTIVPEFEIPENLTPLEMGMLYSNGSFKNELITATIVDLAVKKYITIEEVKKTWLLGSKDFKLTKTASDAEFKKLGVPEAVVAQGLFGLSNEVLLSSLRKKFYAEISGITKAAVNDLQDKELISKRGLTLKPVFLFLAMAATFAAMGLIAIANIILFSSLAICALLLAFFGVVMPKRTPKGAELNWRVKGFKLYMETAEKYRSQFNEKENIFEKFLPYAIMFGIAKLWAQKMEMIYGKEYFATYHPIWYVGAIGNFNADSFTSNLNSLSSSISSNVGTATGAGGGGFAGGGGGGGGGGGW